MKKEIDLLKNYPKTKRDLKERADTKTEEDRAIARKFDKDFFDGDRKHGYGGFKYMSRFWEPVIPTFIKHFELNEKSSVSTKTRESAINDNGISMLRFAVIPSS